MQNITKLYSFELFFWYCDFLVIKKRQKYLDVKNVKCDENKTKTQKKHLHLHCDAVRCSGTTKRLKAARRHRRLCPTRSFSSWL